MIGLDLTAADARFVATIEMVGGVPKVTWSPDLGAERVYRVLGAKGLGSAAAEKQPSEATQPKAARGTEWAEVTEETKGGYNFFKVVVGMP